MGRAAELGAENFDWHLARCLPGRINGREQAQQHRGYRDEHEVRRLGVDRQRRDAVDFARDVNELVTRQREASGCAKN